MTDKKQNEIELSEKTCQIFNAPWGFYANQVKRCFELYDKDEDQIADGFRSLEEVERFALLPALYDALKEAAYEHCHACIEFSSEDGYVPDSSEFVEHGCPKKSKTCFCCKWWTLLKQVRDGK